MLKANFFLKNLQFRKPSGTSRGILTHKPSWYISIWNENQPEIKGIGECSVLEGLSPESGLELHNILRDLVEEFNHNGNERLSIPHNLPAVKFAFETAMLDLNAGGNRILYPSTFTQGDSGIPINGLIWMNDISSMRAEFEQKINDYPCIKFKVGALNMEEELKLLKGIRNSFGYDFEIRLDANEAFEPDEALTFLNTIEPLKIHSIEQPIKRNQWQELTELAKRSPIKIALDEELIGITSNDAREQLLVQVKPDYLIIKPSLVGGLAETMKWTNLCRQHHVEWWVTSALESNIGLNAIAQWTFINANDLPQGLGTGQLFENNIPSPLVINQGQLKYNPALNWKVDEILTA